MKKQEFLGYIKHSKCYHVSKGCSGIRATPRGDESVVIKIYDSELEAISAGHIRACSRCVGNITFLLKDGKSRVFLNKEQFGLVKVITSIFKKSGKMNLEEISKIRKTSIVSTHLLLKKLIKKGLAKHKVKRDSMTASKCSIQPTKEGIEVAESTRLPSMKDFGKY